MAVATNSVMNIMLTENTSLLKVELNTYSSSSSEYKISKQINNYKVVEIIFERNSNMGCNSYSIIVLLTAYLEH